MKYKLLSKTVQRDRYSRIVYFGGNGLRDDLVTFLLLFYWYFDPITIVTAAILEKSQKLIEILEI